MGSPVRIPARFGSMVGTMTTSGVTILREAAPCSLDELRWLAAPVLRNAGAGRALVFGSWARGEADGFSDLDLVVVMETDRPRTERGLDLSRRLDAALPVVVDLLVYTPAEFASGEARRRGVFDALAREGVDILERRR